MAVQFFAGKEISLIKNVSGSYFAQERWQLIFAYDWTHKKELIRYGELEINVPLWWENDDPVSDTTKCCFVTWDQARLEC